MSSPPVTFSQPRRRLLSPVPPISRGTFIGSPPNQPMPPGLSFPGVMWNGPVERPSNASNIARKSDRKTLMQMPSFMSAESPQRARKRKGSPRRLVMKKPGTSPSAAKLRRLTQESGSDYIPHSDASRETLCRQFLDSPDRAVFGFMVLQDPVKPGPFSTAMERLTRNPEVNGGMDIKGSQSSIVTTSTFSTSPSEATSSFGPMHIPSLERSKEDPRKSVRRNSLSLASTELKISGRTYRPNKHSCDVL